MAHSGSKQRITLAEAKRLYPDEWVVLGDPTIDENDVPIEGILVCHTADGDLAAKMSGEYDGDTALEYFGPVRYRRVTLLGKNAVDKPAA